MNEDRNLMKNVHGEDQTNASQSTGRKTSAPNTIMLMNKIAKDTASDHGCNLLLLLLHQVSHGTERRGRARENERKGIGARTATPQTSISQEIAGRRITTGGPTTTGSRGVRESRIAAGERERESIKQVGSSGVCSIEMRHVTY